MTDKKQAAKAALDAVEEQLNLSGAKAPDKQTSNKKEDSSKAESNAEDREQKGSFISKALGGLKGMASKIDVEKREKLKKFASSNLGISVIVIVVFLALWGIHSLRHHSTASTTGAWGTPTTSAQAVPAPQSKVTDKQSVVTTKAPVGFTAPAPQPQLDQVMQKLNDLSVELKNTNQRLMVISKMLIQKNSKRGSVKGNYQILGWRLDQDTNQWIADIEYKGQVKAYYPGQRFGHWVVHSVSANGVKIN